MFCCCCVAMRRECFWSVYCRRLSVPLKGFYMSSVSPVVPACNRNSIGLRKLLVLTQGSICLHVSHTCFNSSILPPTAEILWMYSAKIAALTFAVSCV
jgi:hypothetical protein